jgi:sugar diacid utilization regulator
LLAIARPRDDVLGVLALVDPEHTAGEQEQTALEHGATVLAMELARLRSLADTELRLRRSLVDHLLSGGDEEVARSRAQALDYDLERPHRVLVVEGQAGRGGEEALFHAVHRAARDTGSGVLLGERGQAVLLLSPAEPPFERLRAAILDELDGGSCRIGVGSAAPRPSELARSCEEAEFALSLQATVGCACQVVEFETLGVYQLLSGMKDTASVERFARAWLRALLDYDARKNAELVATLTEYLEHGGSYEGTARALWIHRNTLKYRLQRIREISGHELSDPDTRFNLQVATRAWRTLASLRA